MPGSNIRPTEVHAFRTRRNKRIKFEVKRVRRANTLNIQDLPVEILLMILSLVPVLDVINLSQVSMFFKLLLEDEPFWKSLYRNTRIVRPPGPFPGQSTAFLRKTLISSARVEQNWLPTNLVPLPKRTGPRILLPYTLKYSSFLAGRWLIVGSNEVIWCYDTHDSNPIPTVFYQPHLKANFFRCVSTTNERGELLAFAISETQVGNDIRKLNIYKVFISAEDSRPFICERILQLDISKDVPTVWNVAIGPRLLVVMKPHESIPNNLHVIMDINTFQRYRITVPDSLPPMLPTGEFFLVTYCISTKDYLVLFNFLHALSDRHETDTIIMAYPITPPSSSPTSRGATTTLRTSRITLLPKIQFMNPSLLSETPSSSETTRMVFTGKIFGMPCPHACSLAFLELSLDRTGSTSYTFTPASHTLGHEPLWLETGPDGCARGVALSGYHPTMNLYFFHVDDDVRPVLWQYVGMPNLLLREGTVRIIAFDGYNGVACAQVRTDCRSYVDILRFGV